MCTLDTRHKYPWCDHIIELHHLLPLSSPIRSENSATTLMDLVGVCPTCHRSIHRFYACWLREERLEDFVSADQAREVYSLAKNNLIQ
ncbi:MAG: hypothetical protein EOM36_02520 [Bacteroidia bacterium]|nr:hypothetical protein [Bacteroidia bacterium]